jgi:magnesium transporter
MSRHKNRAARRATPHHPEELPEGGNARITIRLTGADNAKCDSIPAERISDHLQDKGSVLLVRIQDPGPAELEMLREEFGFHRLALEDAARQEQRPKADEYPGYYFVVVYSVLPMGAGEVVCTAEVDLFIGRNYVVALHRGEIPAVDDAMQRWERTDPELRHDVGFLVHTVVDSIIDGYFPVVDAIEDRLDEVEISLFSGTWNQPEELLEIKRSLFALRKATYPMRDVFNLFLRREARIFSAATHPYFQDVYDHVLRLLDIIDIQREMAASALDAHLAVTSNRLNETMKRLTMWTICVAIMSAVFGAWGMNFTAVPLDKWGLTGFYLVTGSALALVGVALVWAKKKDLW